jgi:hypothetical protein
MTKYYTYPVHGFGFTPDPDSVRDHETLEDAYATFLDDINVTVETSDTGNPNDIPPILECANGIVYGNAGWLHVIGRA